MDLAQNKETVVPDRLVVRRCAARCDSPDSRLCVLWKQTDEPQLSNPMMAQFLNQSNNKSSH